MSNEHTDESLRDMAGSVSLILRNDGLSSLLHAIVSRSLGKDPNSKSSPFVLGEVAVELGDDNGLSRDEEDSVTGLLHDEEPGSLPRLQMFGKDGELVSDVRITAIDLDSSDSERGHNDSSTGDGPAATEHTDSVEVTGRRGADSGPGGPVDDLLAIDDAAHNLLTAWDTFGPSASLTHEIDALHAAHDKYWGRS